jgi:hypothetical protein
MTALVMTALPATGLVMTALGDDSAAGDGGRR